MYHPRFDLRLTFVSVARLLLFVLLFLVLEQIGIAVLFTVWPPGRGGFVGRTGVMLAAAVIAGFLMLRVAEHRPAGDLGFALRRSALSETGAGILFGAAGLMIAVTVAALFGSIRYTPDSGTGWQWLFGVTYILIVLALPAAAEEALFRGYPFQKLVEGIGPVAATVLASTAFAAAHARNPSVDTFALVNIFLAGVVLSAAYLLTRSLWFASAVHLGWNWSMAGPADLPVSGLELFDTPLYDAALVGPTWLTGGTFGPEGGVSGFAGLTLVATLVFWYGRRGRVVHD